MKVNRTDPLFSIGCQLFAFRWKFYEGKNRILVVSWVFIFVLPIRNKSPFSGKIITFFKIERMTLNLLAIWPKHKIEMQIIYDGRKVQVWEFVSQGLNIGKWSTGKHCDEVALVKNVKTIMCQEGGTFPLNNPNAVEVSESCCTSRIRRHVQKNNEDPPAAGRSEFR